jgi:hypothetical protein
MKDARLFAEKIWKNRMFFNVLSFDGGNLQIHDLLKKI